MFRIGRQLAEEFLGPTSWFDVVGARGFVHGSLRDALALRVRAKTGRRFEPKIGDFGRFYA